MTQDQNLPWPLKEGDTSPAFKGTLKDGAGVVVDVTGSTVVFSMVNEAGGEPVIDEAAATILDGQGGVVAYAWQAGDTDRPGIYLAEFKVTFADLTVATFPNDGYRRIKIGDDI